MEKTRYQRFTVETVRRSGIRPHPRNPRQIAAKAQRRLKGKIKEVGTIEPIIVNVRTGFVVGGHQRLGILDQLEGFDPETGANDYLLDVSLCDLDDKQELAMLAFLNNPSAQGMYDLDLLADLNLELGVSFEAMGFDQLDVDYLFDGDARFSEIFRDEPEVVETKERLDAVKAARADAVDGMAEKNSAEFYFVVVCSGPEEMAEIKGQLGVPTHEQFVSGDAVLGALGV